MQHTDQELSHPDQQPAIILLKSMSVHRLFEAAMYASGIRQDIAQESRYVDDERHSFRYNARPGAWASVISDGLIIGRVPIES